MTFRPAYARGALVVFVVEVAIALFVHDGFVRPYLGDSLAVVLVYLALRAVAPIGVAAAAASAFAVACLVELGQWAGLLDALGLRGSAVARVVLGTGFDPRDLLAYAAGAAGAIVLEASRRITPRRG